MEEAFAQQLELEKRAKEAERERLEQERLAHRKQQEMQRITELRRQESQRDKKNEELLNGTNNVQKPETDVSTGSPFLTKSNSVAHMFTDRIRRGQDIKRAESMKTSASKPVKRTPSFTTRRRSSFRVKCMFCSV